MSDRLSVRADEISWTPTDDGTVVVLDLRTSRYLSLNNSGAKLWTRLADGATEAELAAVLTDSYGLAADRAQQDVQAFLAALRARDLLADVG